MMLKRRIIITLLATLLSSSLALAGSRQVTVILNSERPMTQGIALVLANQMLEQGAQLKILLCDAAGDLALRDAPVMEPLRANNLTPEQLLLGALKKGAVVEVCALYLPQAGKQPADLKEGVTPAKPPAIAAELLQDDRVVLVF